MGQEAARRIATVKQDAKIPVDVLECARARARVRMPLYISRIADDVVYFPYFRCRCAFPAWRAIADAVVHFPWCG